MTKRINFRAISEAALNRSESLVAAWLPSGKRHGHEWRCGNLSGDAGNSLAVNLTTGLWSDFSSGDKGGDLVSLYAAIFTAGDQAQAARELAAQLSMDAVERIGAPASSSTGPTANAKKRTPWIPVTPVPESAGPPPVAHVARGKPEASWQYFDRDGKLLGLAYRFRTSDGGKDIIPCVWARHEVSGAQKWHWLSFPEPRPLYGLDRLGDDKPVLIVEGEKCVDAAFGLIGSTFDVLSWPGGGKAVSKADFSPIEGRKVIVWPDCDAKHVVDKDPSSPLLPANDQPGMKAAWAVVKAAVKLGCQVHLVRIPDPGEKPDGWDVADFIAEGVTADDLIKWMRERLVKPAEAVVTKSISTPRGATAEKDEWWGRKLIQGSRGGYNDCKENVAIALLNHPDLLNLVAKNDFSETVEKIRPAPWESENPEFRPVEWTVHDDRELSMFLAVNARVTIGSTGTIGEGVAYVANRARYHPVRAWLTSLTWDGKDRNSRWLTELLGVEDTPYSQLVGALWLRQAVNRILNPGCQGDYVLILEGHQGLNKSTALRHLGGDYFSDVALNLNDKDSMMMLSGIWIYEIAELDAFNRVESTRIKQWISQKTDRFRPPYERRLVNVPRQTVFAATTNHYEYHKDPTGNRRFWSVRCNSVDLVKIDAWREQMFAQAMHEVMAGEQCYPSREQERDLIIPEQEQREIGDPWFQPIGAWLQDAGQINTNEFSSWEILVGAIKMATDKMDGQRSATTRVGNCMAKMGWQKRRGEKNRQRLWLYVRPEAERIAASASQDYGEDDDRLPI